MNYLNYTIGELVNLKYEIKNKYYWRHLQGLIKILEEYNRQKYQLNKTKNRITKI